uniref:ARAD1D44924p n=1 Tax=Blastobotrys adeninivorans TaxID=409370 RepID=A0A060TDL7_BLAAD
MAGHAKYSAGNSSIPFPKIPASQRWIGKLLGGAMWFWIFYRVREEGPVLLGWRHPWEHGHHGHDEEH